MIVNSFIKHYGYKKSFLKSVAECNNGNESIICYKKQGTGEEFQLPILVCKPLSTNKFMIIR